MRVLFAHWTEPGEDGRSTLVSEARVDPVDPTARMRLRALWTVIGPFERLVGAEPLTVAARRAEARVADRVTREDLVRLRQARDLMDREYARPLDVPALARAQLRAGTCAGARRVGAFFRLSRSRVVSESAR